MRTLAAAILLFIPTLACAAETAAAIASDAASSGASTRATTSVGPPGAKPTSSVMGLSG